MKTLELNKVWTGDGYGAVDAITLSQIKRTETVALYHRARKSGMTDGYEVFVIKMRHKGDKLPGNMVELEDREVYPSAGSFGKTAWHIMNLDRANEKFDELVRKGAIDDEEDSVKVETIYPSTAFTAGMLAEANGIQYINAAILIKEGVANGSLVFVEERRLNVKGKASKFYKKVS